MVKQKIIIKLIHIEKNTKIIMINKIKLLPKNTNKYYSLNNH